MSPATRFLRFNGVSALGIAVQLGTVHTATIWLGADAIVATAGGVLTAVVHNFVWHRRWTWADRRATSGSILATFSRFALANGLVSLVGNVAIVTLATTTTGMSGVQANVVAIAICGLLNYSLGDYVVFHA